MLDLYALVEPLIDLPADMVAVELDGFSAVATERTQAPELTEESLRMHDRVVRMLAERSRAILPVRFGSLLPSAAALIKVLGPRTVHLRAALDEVRDREQMTIRLRSGGYAEEPEVPGGPGTRYLARKLRAEKVPELDPLCGELSAFIRAEKRERGASAAWVASAFHLIDRGGSGPYAERASQLAHALGLAVELFGPSPPYAFAPSWEAS